MYKHAALTIIILLLGSFFTFGYALAVSCQSDADCSRLGPGITCVGGQCDEYGLLTASKPEGAEIDLQKFTDIPTALGRFLGGALSLVGILFFALTVYGGVVWMTSHGNSEQSGKGLKIVVSAIAGLIVVLASYTLVNFVFKAGTGQGDKGRSPTPGETGQEQGLFCCVYPNPIGDNVFTTNIFPDEKQTPLEQCRDRCGAEGTDAGVCQTQASVAPVVVAAECG